jgi:hypothetical protein
MVEHKRITFLKENNITGGGVYCIYPFSTLDKKGKGVFKIGVANSSFYNRCEGQYHTFFPMGFQYKALLERPILKKNENETKNKYYEKIEKEIYDRVVREKCSTAIFSGARIVLGGKTEWVYTTQRCIERAFDWAEKRYGGTYHDMNLTKKVLARDEPTPEDTIFVGEIKFHNQAR